MMMDNDSPKALGFLQSYLQGEGKYKQQGDVPNLELETQYAQEFGGPLVQETMISGSPSFDIEQPGYGPAVSKDRFMDTLEYLYPGSRERARNAVPNLLRKAPQLRGV